MVSQIQEHTMSAIAQFILNRLGAVANERHLRQSTAGLDAKVRAVKAYQQRRFSNTYADLLGSDRYAPASRFFLDELYGPGDFERRDAQFARVVPALVRLFPKVIVHTVATLADLHALSETLDTEMSTHLQQSEELTGHRYISAWQATGRRQDRTRQIALTLEVAGSLDRITRNALTRTSLRLMRGPAHSAGLGELQAFLEAGFDTFKAMHGADEFVAMIRSREEHLASALFDAKLTSESDGTPSAMSALAALPPDC